jgi:cytoskeletal protein RodZ
MTSAQRRPNNTQQNPVRTDETTEAPVIVTIQKPAEREPKLPLERIGDILRNERERRGDDLQQIADYLCIRRGFLVALENNRYDEFPADAYVIGFLRSYAEYLGLGGKDAIDRYRKEMAGRRKKPTLSVPTPISEGRAPSAFIMTGAAVAAMLIYIAWYGISTSDRAAVISAPVLPSTPAAETLPNNVPTTPASVAPPPPAMAPAIPAPIAPTATPQNQASSAPPVSALQDKSPVIAHVPQLTIKAKQACWILIADGKGHTIYDHVLKPGEDFKVPNTPGLTLTTGNGGGIVLALDGVDLPKLSTGTSHVLHNIPRDSAYLKALPAAPE